MSNKKKNWFQKIFIIIIPLIIAMGITFFSLYLFEQNKVETYEALKLEKEMEVKRIVREVDNLVLLSSDKTLTSEQKQILKLNIKSINSQEGIHCYLLDKDFNYISEYSDEMTELDNSILYTLKHTGTIREDITLHDNGDDSDNYFKISTSSYGNYEFYWKRVPTENTEFYILIGVSQEKVEMNEAFQISKTFITVLDLLLIISLYGNIYFHSKLEEKEEN